MTEETASVDAIAISRHSILTEEELEKRCSIVLKRHYASNSRLEGIFVVHSKNSTTTRRKTLVYNLLTKEERNEKCQAIVHLNPIKIEGKSKLYEWDVCVSNKNNLKTRHYSIRFRGYYLLLR